MLKEHEDHLKAMEKFSKQLHMYTPEQLRNTLKIAIGITRDALGSRDIDPAPRPGDESSERIAVILPRDSDFRAFPGEDIRIEVSNGEETLWVFQAKVGSVKGREIYCLEDLPDLKPERRGANRVPVHARAEYCSYHATRTGEGTFTRGTILNISETGLLLASSIPLRMQQDLMLMFEVDWDDRFVKPVIIVGTVVREQETTVGEVQQKQYGVRFTSPFKAA